MTPVDVQIVAYGGLDPLRACMASALVPEVARMVVVDHLGNIPADIVDDSRLQVVTDETNPGFAAGHNRAMAHGDSPFVLLLNPDAVLVAGALGGCVSHLQGNPAVGAVQGAVENSESGEPERSHGVEIRPVHLFGRALRLRRLLAMAQVHRLSTRSASVRDHVERRVEAPTEVETLAATCVLIRRSALEGIGGFDPTYFLYGEDLDLCRRLRRAGWKLVALPTVVARHVSGGSSGTTWHRELQWWQGTMQFAASWWDGRSFALGVVASALVTLQLAVRAPLRAPTVARALVIRPVRIRRGRTAGPAVR